MSSLDDLPCFLEIFARFERIADKAGSYAALKDDKEISDGGSGRSSSQSGERVSGPAMADARFKKEPNQMQRRI